MLHVCFLLVDWLLTETEVRRDCWRPFARPPCKVVNIAEPKYSFKSFNDLPWEIVLKIVCMKWFTLSRWFYFLIKREKLILWIGVYIQLCDWTMKGWRTQYSDKTRASIKIFWSTDSELFWYWTMWKPQWFILILYMSIKGFTPGQTLMKIEQK